MRAITTAARAVLGGYLAVHGAQKLFGMFGGGGLDRTAAGFERMGLTPAREMATLAGVAELGGGLLTATGVADPLGPITLASTMAVASTVHRKAGPMSANGGYELPLTNLAFALVLATARPGHRVGPTLPRAATAVVLVGAAGLTGLALSKLLAPAPEPERVADAVGESEAESAGN